MKPGSIEEIDAAKWEKDDCGCKWLRVNDAEGRPVAAWIALRPSYCDRGHIQMVVEGPLNIDGHDSFPRFFFSFAEADQHTRDFLKWRLFKHRMHPHSLD